MGRLRDLQYIFAVTSGSPSSFAFRENLNGREGQTHQCSSLCSHIVDTSTPLNVCKGPLQRHFFNWIEINIERWIKDCYIIFDQTSFLVQVLLVCSSLLFKLSLVTIFDHIKNLWKTTKGLGSGFGQIRCFLMDESGSGSFSRVESINRLTNR